MAFIEQHNAEADQGMHTFTVGVNHFTDLTVQEFAALMNGFNKTKNLFAGKPKKVFAADNGADVPDSVDWRTKVGIPIFRNRRAYFGYF